MDQKHYEHISGAGHTSGQEKSFEQKIDEDIREGRKRVTETGKQAIVREVSNIGDAMHSAAIRLHEQNDYFAGWADRAADSIDSVSRYIEKKETGEIVSAFSDVSRKNPYVMIGGMFVAGLVLSRFVKAGI
jgi:hypothetical protein